MFSGVVGGCQSQKPHGKEIWCLGRVSQGYIVILALAQWAKFSILAAQQTAKCRQTSKPLWFHKVGDRGIPSFPSLWVQGQHPVFILTISPGMVKGPIFKHLPLSLISKQIRKQDCIISHTDSLVRWAPTGVSKRVRSTYQEERGHTMINKAGKMKKGVPEVSEAASYSSTLLRKHLR